MIIVQENMTLNRKLNLIFTTLCKSALVKCVPGIVDSLMEKEISIKEDLLYRKTRVTSLVDLADFLIDHKH